MKLKALIELLKLDTLYIDDKALNKEYEFFFASNMMSNVLLMINDNYQSTILLTGLTNTQSLITAEMLDVNAIIYLTEKIFSNEVIELAKSKNINIFRSSIDIEDMIQCLTRNGVKEIKWFVKNIM